MEAPPVYGPIHGVVGDPGQGFQGTGSKGEATSPMGGVLPRIGRRAPPATRLPSTSQPRGGSGAPCPRRSLALSSFWRPPRSAQLVLARPPTRARGCPHSLSHGVHQALVLPVVRVKGRVVDEKVRLHKHGGSRFRLLPRTAAGAQAPRVTGAAPPPGARRQGPRERPQSAHGSSVLGQA